MNKILSIFSQAGTTFRQYPMVLLSSFLAIVCAISASNTSADYIVFNKSETTLVPFDLWGLSIILLLGICMFFTAKTLSERIGKYYLLNGMVLLLLAAFYWFVLPSDIRYINQKETILIIICFLSAHLLVAVAPFVSSNQKEENFWEYNKNLFVYFVLAAMFSLVLTGGILLAYLALENLFGFTIKEKWYLYTFWFTAGFGSTFIFLSFCKKLSHLETINAQFPTSLKVFTQFILIPLLTIYGVILYFYGLKILFAWNLPQGWVSYMIMAYSLVGILAYLLVYPLGKSTENNWVKFFLKIFFYSLLPLLVLLFVAIFTRVLEYGVTENRYYVVMIALWLSVISLYFVIKNQPSIRWIPITLLGFALFSIWMPIFNVFQFSIYSQKRALVSILEKNKMIYNGIIDLQAAVSYKDAMEISEKMVYLVKRNQEEYLQQLLPYTKSTEFVFNLQNKYVYYEDFFRLFENVKENYKEEFNDVEIVTSEIAIKAMYFMADVEIPVGFTNVVDVSPYSSKVYLSAEETYESKDLEVTYVKGSKKEIYDLTQDVEKFYEKISKTEGDDPATPIFFELGDYQFALYLRSITKYDDDYTITNNLLFYKKMK